MCIINQSKISTQSLYLQKYKIVTFSFVFFVEIFFEKVYNMTIMNDEIKSYFKSLLNVPNILTLIRILCVPLFIIFFFMFENYIPALIVFVGASLTDMLDGFLARKLNMVTPVGMVLDPLADKLLKASALFCFAFVGVVQWWFFGILCFVDVSMIVVGCFLFGRHITIPSNIIGKLGTLVISVGLIFCFFPDVFAPWNEYILYAGFGVVISSVVLYVSLNYKSVFKTLKDENCLKTGKNSSKNSEKTCEKPEK